MRSPWGRPPNSRRFGKIALNMGGVASPVRAPPENLEENAYFLVRRSRRRYHRRSGWLWGGDDLALQPLDGRFVQGLGFEQGRRGAVEQRAVLLQNAKGLLEGAVDELGHR